MMADKIKKIGMTVIAVLFVISFTTFSAIGKQEFQTIQEDRLRSFFLKYIESMSQGDDIELSRFRVRGAEQFPTGAVELRAVNSNPGSIKGRVNMTVGVWIDGKDEGRIFLSGWVDRYASVVCAEHRLPRGTLLTENDIQLRKMNVARAPANLVTDKEDAVGMRLKQSLKAGAYLRNNMLEKPPLIRRGDTVSLVAEKGKITVVTSGIAKSDGTKDEQIRVENADSRKIVVGRVIDEKSVEVVF